MNHQSIIIHLFQNLVGLLEKMRSEERFMIGDWVKFRGKIEKNEQNV